MSASESPPTTEPYLTALNATPEALRAMPAQDLAGLAGGIRAFLVENAGAIGSHLDANLGVVELTIALHRVFRSPHDVLLFDKGHQAYVHKIITGRAPAFSSLRQRGGLSGYPSRRESDHDWLDSSQASTSLAYADGLAKAFQLQGMAHRHVVSVIGDGAFSGGLAWEALNNLTDPSAAGRPVVIVLNDNSCSDTPTIGGFARLLTELNGRRANRSWPGAPDIARTVFTQLGLHYVGPVDGHDIPALETALTDARSMARPVLVHCVTEKSRRYAPAGVDGDGGHDAAAPDFGTDRPTKTEQRSWTSVFGEEIANIADRRPDVVAITAAALRPRGLRAFAERNPDRIFDVGIAEQQAVCSAAGLAMGGLHPVVSIYATHLSRVFDQVLTDIGLHDLPVTFVLDRAGLTDPDDTSHHGLWDLALLSLVPGLHVAAPRDSARLREVLNEAISRPHPTAIRFPRTTLGPDLEAVEDTDGIDILYRSQRRSKDVLLIAAGAMAPACVEAAHLLDQSGHGATVIDPRWVLPLNPALLQYAKPFRFALTVEDGLSAHGLGAALIRAASMEGFGAGCPKVVALGLPTAFIEHGPRSELLNAAGLTARGITARALNALNCSCKLSSSSGVAILGRSIQRLELPTEPFA